MVRVTIGKNTTMGGDGRVVGWTSKGRAGNVIFKLNTIGRTLLLGSVVVS